MLHILNSSPLERPTLDSLTRLANSGALLLIEDAVYAATRGNGAEGQIREAMSKLKVYVLMPDLEARGMADRLIEGVTPVDYEGFVGLVVDHPNNQSWF
ncbi:MAG: sulfurtransferase complex subunit TusB [Gemmatimonadota bacterium]